MHLPRQIQRNSGLLLGFFQNMTKKLSGFSTPFNLASVIQIEEAGQLQVLGQALNLSADGKEVDPQGRELVDLTTCRGIRENNRNQDSSICCKQITN